MSSSSPRARRTGSAPSTALRYAINGSPAISRGRIGRSLRASSEPDRREQHVRVGQDVHALECGVVVLDHECEVEVAALE